MRTDASGGRLLVEKVTLVTGAAQGIGAAIARIFAAHGAAVLIADIDDGRARKVANEIIATGGRATSLHTDVRSAADLERAVRSAVGEWGRLDVMVNNAGVPRDSLIESMTDEVWQDIIDVHLRGTFLGIRSASAAMMGGEGGAIINMSSIVGKVGAQGQANYSAAKAGIIGLTKSAAKELGPRGIRVNAIQPGTIRTDRTSRIDPSLWAAKVADVPLGRDGSPEEVASVAMFLASDLASYVTGAVIEVTGGRHL